MSGAKHTPGPWCRIGAPHWGSSKEIAFSISGVRPARAKDRLSSGYEAHQVVVGFVRDFSAWDDDAPRSPETIANANLIAAAPDLLAACEAFREGTECSSCGGFPWCHNDTDKPHRLADAMIAAIAKAKGGAK